MSKTRRQPSEEEIAAFAAGQLHGAERSRMIEHLDRDPESYQLLLETIELLERSDSQGDESEEDETTPLAMGSKHLAASRWRVAALAASALLALGLGWLLYLALPHSGGPGQLALQLSARLSSQASPDELSQQAWNEAPIRNFAGARSIFASFRLGRMLLDLEIARSAGDLPRGRSLLAQIESLLTVHQAGPIALEEAAQASRKVEAQQSLDGLEQFPQRMVISLPASWDPFFLSFGQWAEASRLASLQQQKGFFQEPSFQDFAKQLQGRDDLQPQVRNTWAQAQTLLEKPQLDPDGWDELTRKWADLIRLH